MCILGTYWSSLSLSFTMKIEPLTNITMAMKNRKTAPSPGVAEKKLSSKIEQTMLFVIMLFVPMIISEVKTLQLEKKF